MERTSRRPAKISESLQRHLNAYALAASAAGVGVLALANPAECLLPAGVALAGLLATPETAQAKIVYTPTHKVIPSCGYSGHGRPCFNLDMNHEKIADFTFFLSRQAHWVDFAIRPAAKQSKNEIWGTISTVRCATSRTCKYSVASALSSGVSVGPNSVKFKPGHSAMWSWRSESFGTKWGKWYNAKNKYLGLLFYIKGKVHYGWARLNDRYGDDAILTGYAYETTPNKPIITGKTHGPDVITLEPGSLGRLAQGSAGRLGK
jgi:hypothetical protein